METKSSWASKINWTQIVGMAAMLLTVFGIEMDADTQVAAIAGIQGITSVVTWVLRTWFTDKLIA
jgi:hypothetical protein